MNTTHRVSIGGMAFIVEESAYHELKAYIEKLERHFQSKVGGNEIIADIESRIAELLNDKLTTNEQLVTLADIKDVLAQMGDPAEMDEGAEPAGSDTYTDSGYSHTTRRLYRSSDNKVLGGVCGGLGAYLGIDPVWLRVALVAIFLVGTPFAFGWVFFVAYIVMWIIVPVAVTVSQKLEMEGKNVNVSNIEQRIRQEASNLTPRIKTVGERIMGVVGTIIKIFAVFIISVFVIAGLALSVGLLLAILRVSPDFMGVFGDFHSSSDFAIFNIAYNFFPHMMWFKVSVLSLVLIPTVLLITLVVKLLFRSRLRTRYVVIPLVILWVVALFTALITGVSAFKQTFGSSTSVTETINAPNAIDTLRLGYAGSLSIGKNDMLLAIKNGDSHSDDVNLTVNGVNIIDVKHHNRWDDRLDLSVLSGSTNADINLNSQSTIYVRPVVTVEFSDLVDRPRVLVKKWATGTNYAIAKENSENIQFNAVFKGDSLLITPATPIKMDEKILKGIEVTVLIPQVSAYSVSPEMRPTLKGYDCKRVNGVYIYDPNNRNENEWDGVTDVDTVVVN